MVWVEVLPFVSESDADNAASNTNRKYLLNTSGQRLAIDEREFDGEVVIGIEKAKIVERSVSTPKRLWVTRLVTVCTVA
jgi:hypothetical protein